LVDDEKETPDDLPMERGWSLKQKSKSHGTSGFGKLVIPG
jgi:hypothetical protein